MTERTATIHIGLHKCASTTLQQALTENRWSLQEQGYFYSVDHLPSRTQHSHLALFLRSGEHDAYRTAIKAIHNDFLDSRCKNIVFSGEEFSTLRPELVGQFCRSIRELGFPAELKVILYVRNLYRFMLSLIAQYSKSGDAIVYPQTAVARMRGFNLGDVIRRWELVAGQDNVRVECLDAFPPGADIITSFADFTATELFEIRTELRESNQSADIIASAILSHLSFEFSLPDTLFYRAYFSELRHRFALPRIEFHQYGLIDEWVSGIDLLHPKLLAFQSALRAKPIEKLEAASDSANSEPLEEYLLFMSSVLQNASIRVKDRRLRLSRDASGQ